MMNSSLIPSLFLSTKVPGDSEGQHEDDGNKHLVWQVADLGGNKKNFQVKVPTTTGHSQEAGRPKIGFGTITDDEAGVTVRDYELAPAQLMEDGTWQKVDQDILGQDGQLFAKNMTSVARSITLGVFDDSKKDPEPLMPFLVVDQKNFGPEGSFSANSDLYLHAFSTNGCRAGQYGDGVMKEWAMNRLTPQKGCRVKDLKPLTTYYVSRSSNNGVKMKIGKNRPDDVKKFRMDRESNFGSPLKWFKRKDKGKQREENVGLA
ncbi:hypothetical protein NLI96_g8166 [Meripilus lineatus]|uniref:Uncharacterized protein n=1 Tax=Meripilus lineatus TaxID=2056292 RepID=A0AAD5YBC9_9APHY|nr:hypothetical protein NLI96_g8166 [Physisporinus lineatus]